MKVAVLGSSGFLGSYIVNNLNGYDILPVTRNDLTLTDYDSVRDWLISNKPDAIINCATAGGKTKLGEVNLTELQNNISIFLNFYNNSELVSKFINVGSGSEFDITTNIENVTEEDILTRVPTETYGYGKNLISRMILEKKNFYTLRLFGCFDKSEPEFRLFKKVLNGQVTSIHDRKFDYFSASDFVKVIVHYIDNDNLPKDINCVYPEKLTLEKILYKLQVQVDVLGVNPHNYTAEGSKLSALGLDLSGLDKSISDYIN